jgi:hypothetical protein
MTMIPTPILFDFFVSSAPFLAKKCALKYHFIAHFSTLFQTFLLYCTLFISLHTYLMNCPNRTGLSSLSSAKSKSNCAAFANLSCLMISLTLNLSSSAVDSVVDVQSCSPRTTCRARCTKFKLNSLPRICRIPKRVRVAVLQQSPLSLLEETDFPISFFLFSSSPQIA